MDNNGYIPDTHGCAFHGIDTDTLYMCYKNEVCCEEGCCAKPFLASFRMCYVWVAVIVIIFACTGGFQYCKSLGTGASAGRRNRDRIEATAARRRRAMMATRIDSLANLEVLLQNSVPRLANLEERACHAAIDRYISCRNERTREGLGTRVAAVDVARSAAPPPYDSIGSTKPVVAAPPAPGDAACDPPPHYNTVVCNVRLSLSATRAGGAENQPGQEEGIDSRDGQAESDAK